MISLKWLGVLPWAAMLAGMPLVNHARPFVLGLPLPLAWSIGCVLLSSVTLFVVFLLDPANRAR